MIECVVNASRPINEEISAFLHRKASEMIRDKELRRRLRGKVCRGFMTTKGEYGNLGSISGLLFTAEVEYEGIDLQITFIVRQANLESHEDNWRGAPLPIIEQLVALDEREDRGHRKLH